MSESLKTRLTYLALFSFFILALVWRFDLLSYGVDLGDESFVMTWAVVITKGATPFIQIKYPIIASIFIINYPFSEIYASFYPELDGIIYASRILYFIIIALCGFALSIIFRKNFGWPISLFVGFALTALSPLFIQNIYYKSQLTLFFTLSSSLLYYSITRNNHKTLALFFSGLFFGLCAISYFTIIPLVIIPLVYLIIQIKDKRFIKIMVYFLGMLLPIEAFFIYLHSIGVGFYDLINGLFPPDTTSVYVSNSYWLFIEQIARKIYKAHLLFDELPVLFIFAYYVFLLAIIEIIRHRRFAWIIYTILPLILYIPLTLYQPQVNWSRIPLIIFLFNGYFVFRFLDSRKRGPILWSFLIPSFYLGIISFITSASGKHNFSLGLYSSLTAFFIIIYEIQQESIPSAIKASRRKLISVQAIPALIFLFIAPFSYWYGSYDDPKMHSTSVSILDEALGFQGDIELIEVGPFKGLHTTNFEAEYLININKDIRTIESNYSLSEVLIDFTFWSGPLLTHYHQPTPPMVINELSPYLELIDDHQRRPDYIFIHKYDFRPVPPRKYDIYSSQGNLLKNILLKYRIVKTSPYYDIVALKNSHFTEIKFDN